MTHLYSCRHSGDQYRITKLTHNMDVESSYLCTLTECECPAGEKRGRCRHMEMLPKFITRGAIDTGWMFDYDRGGWVDNRTDDELVSTGADLSPLPEGVSAFSLEDPVVLHNAIAEAVGEAPAAPAEQALDKMMGADADDWAKLEQALKPAWRRF